MSLLAVQRPIAPIPGYPAYDRYARIATALLGGGVHPWVALAALRAAATACMESNAVAIASATGIGEFSPQDLPHFERPNHRLAALLAHGFSTQVAAAEAAARSQFGSDRWWSPAQGSLDPSALDGEPGDAHARLFRHLNEHARVLIAEAGGTSIKDRQHHASLRELLTQAQPLAPNGLTRIGALAESPGGNLMHGGALDSQTIKLTSAPKRAVVLPHGSASGLSGTAKDTHAFLVVTRPERIRVAFDDIQGVPLPDDASAAFLRSTVYDDDDERDCVLFVAADEPGKVELDHPVYVSAFSSAVASDPERATAWMQWAEPERVSLVMDTPLSAALKRWCADGGRFRTETRAIAAGGMELRVIVGRVENGNHRSPLVVIPTTEFGARWFQASCREDPELRELTVDDDQFFDHHGKHLNIVLNHLLHEERFVGTGSWR